MSLWRSRLIKNHRQLITGKWLTDILPATKSQMQSSDELNYTIIDR